MSLWLEVEGRAVDGRGGLKKGWVIRKADWWWWRKKREREKEKKKEKKRKERLIRYLILFSRGA